MEKQTNPKSKDLRNTPITTGMGIDEKHPGNEHLGFIASEGDPVKDAEDAAKIAEAHARQDNAENEEKTGGNIPSPPVTITSPGGGGGHIDDDRRPQAPR